MLCKMKALHRLMSSCSLLWRCVPLYVSMNVAMWEDRNGFGHQNPSAAGLHRVRVQWLQVWFGLTLLEALKKTK